MSRGRRVNRFGSHISDVRCSIEDEVVTATRIKMWKSINWTPSYIIAYSEHITNSIATATGPTDWSISNLYESSCFVRFIHFGFDAKQFAVACGEAQKSGVHLLRLRAIQRWNISKNVNFNWTQLNYRLNEFSQLNTYTIFSGMGAHSIGHWKIIDDDDVKCCCDATICMRITFYIHAIELTSINSWLSVSWRLFACLFFNLLRGTSGPLHIQS